MAETVQTHPVAPRVTERDFSAGTVTRNWPRHADSGDDSTRGHDRAIEMSPRLSLQRAKTRRPEPTQANVLDVGSIEMVGFARKIEDCREAEFRLANRRLQPLGHLTANTK